jgi:hypothetical protein
MPKEENLMPGRESSRAIGTALIVVAVTLIAFVVSVPYGWAAGKFRSLYAFKAQPTDAALWQA